MFKKEVQEINECEAERQISSEKTIAAMTIENLQHFHVQAESPEKALSQINSTTDLAIKKTLNYLN